MLPETDQHVKSLNTVRLKQNGCHLADDILKFILLNENSFDYID